MTEKSPFYTRTGDSGTTGILGEGRVPKDDLRIEAVGTVDEASAALGVARASVRGAGSAELLLCAQRDLYRLMAELSATPKTVALFRGIDAERVAWLESETDRVAQLVALPREFVVPGDTPVGAALDLARAIVRRAERRIVGLLREGAIDNPELLRYLNRLSSLCFVLARYEDAMNGAGAATLAKEEGS